MAAQQQLIEALLRPSTAAARPPAPSDKEEQSVQKLVHHFSQADLTLPTNLAHIQAQAQAQGGKKPPGSEKGHEKLPLSDWEKCSTLSRESLLRALRADRWDVEKAKKRLEETIVWRRECGRGDIDISNQLDIVRKEGPTGKLFILGFDKQQRPIVHMRPRFQNTTVTPDRLTFTFWALDRAIDLMSAGQEKMLLVIDLTGPSEKPAVRQQMEFLKVLANYFNERLGKAVLNGMPFVFAAAFKIIRPFIDPVTFDKISFDAADVLKLCPADQIDASFNGTNGFEWDAGYWDILVAECDKRRQEKLARWQRAGAKVGLTEWDFEATAAPQVAAGSDPEKVAAAPTPSKVSEVGIAA